MFSLAQNTFLIQLCMTNRKKILSPYLRAPPSPQTKMGIKSAPYLYQKLLIFLLLLLTKFLTNSTTRRRYRSGIIFSLFWSQKVQKVNNLNAAENWCKKVPALKCSNVLFSVWNRSKSYQLKIFLLFFFIKFLYNKCVITKF